MTTGTLTLAKPSLAGDLRITPQARKILAHLEAGKSITPTEALVVYSISRLASCIGEIRKAGYDVLTEHRRDETGHKYGRYTMVKPETIN
jgi:DNA invertase Pin-like site-specific DNA recombinase